LLSEYFHFAAHSLATSAFASVVRRLRKVERRVANASHAK